MVDQSDSLHPSAPQLFHSHIIVWMAINLTSHFMWLISPLMSWQLQFQFVWYSFLGKPPGNNEWACSRQLSLVSLKDTATGHMHGHALAVVLLNVIGEMCSKILKSDIYSRFAGVVMPGSLTFRSIMTFVSSTYKAPVSTRTYNKQLQCFGPNKCINLNPNFNGSMFAGSGNQCKI